MDELNRLICIKILEMRISSLDPLLTMFEELVVLGLFIEVVTVARDWRHELCDFWRGTIHTPENPGLAKLFWALAGTILIAVGVAGEVAIHLKSSRIEVEMRDTSDILAAEITKEAGIAKLKAAQLESQMADRHITLEQRKKIIEILTPRRGSKIAIGYITDSGTDSLKYSLELGEVFCDAKWLAFRTLGLVSTESPVRGFLLESMPNSVVVKPLLAPVRKALAVTGYDVVLQEPTNAFQVGGMAPMCGPKSSSSSPAWHPTDIQILVGSK